jgi:hypothetical protein
VTGGSTTAVVVVVLEVVVLEVVVLDVVGLEADVALGAPTRPPAGPHAPSTMATSTISNVAGRGR